MDRLKNHIDSLLDEQEKRKLNGNDGKLQWCFLFVFLYRQTCSQYAELRANVLTFSPSKIVFSVTLSFSANPEH